MTKILQSFGKSIHLQQTVFKNVPRMNTRTTGSTYDSEMITSGYKEGVVVYIMEFLSIQYSNIKHVYLL